MDSADAPSRFNRSEGYLSRFLKRVRSKSTDSGVVPRITLEQGQEKVLDYLKNSNPILKSLQAIKRRRSCERMDYSPPPRLRRNSSTVGQPCECSCYPDPEKSEECSCKNSTCNASQTLKPAYIKLVPKTSTVNEGPFAKEAIICTSDGCPDDLEALLPSQEEFTVFPVENENLIFVDFMMAHKCADLIPASTKVIVLDTQLTLSKAFFALVDNDVRAAPLWDSDREKFVGMLTITDFIDTLLKYSDPEIAIKRQTLEHDRICEWKKTDDEIGPLGSLISIDPDKNIVEALRILADRKIHRLPLVDQETGNIVFTLSHKRILRFLLLYIHDLPLPKFVHKSLKELGVGCWSHIHTVTPNTLLLDAFKLLVTHHISALPIVDPETKQLKDIYSKFDAIHLAAENTYSDLNVSLKDALKCRVCWCEGVRSCHEDDSLLTLMGNLVHDEVHRMVIVNDEQLVTGIVSRSDVLKYLAFPQSSTDPILETVMETHNVCM